MSNKTQISTHTQANGDDVPQASVIQQMRQNNYDQEDVPLKTRLPQSQINQNFHQVQEQVDNFPQPIQQPLSQNLELQQRQQYNEMIHQKKQLDQHNEIYNNNKSFGNQEFKKEDKLILLAPSKPYSREPQVLQCEKCQSVMISKVESKPGWGKLAFLLFNAFNSFFLFVFFTFLYESIKYMINKYCKDAHHYCQSCQNKLGTYYFIFE